MSPSPDESSPADVSSPTDPASPPPGRGLHLRVALAVAPLVALVVLAEATLWALGLGDPALQPPSGRGFDPEAAYFRADPERDGGYVTQLFGDEREVRIAPRDDRRRVLLLGGSNTMLLPEVLLEEALVAGDAADPADARGWEVINLGRAGYGSARVLILVEQALRLLDPDVVVIYSGHNEFVEAGFRFEVEGAPELALEDAALGGDVGGDGEARDGADDRAGDAGALDTLAELVGGLRSYRALERALRPAAAPPTDFDPVDHYYGDITWAGTLQVYDAYEENLRRMVRACRGAGVPVVLCTVVGNDWCPPQKSEMPAEADERRIRLGLQVLSRVVERIPERFRLIHRGETPMRLRVGRWFGGHFGPYEPPPLPELRGALADRPAWNRGDEEQDSVEGALWPDPADWTEVTRDLVDRALAHQQPTVELTEAEREDLAWCVDALVRFRQRAPDHSSALFLEGQARWLLGERAAGAELLREAAAYDRAPRRGNRTTNLRVRAVAEEEGARLHDAAARFRAWTLEGAAGYAVLMDGCHLQPGARRALLADLAPTVREVAEAAGR